MTENNQHGYLTTTYRLKMYNKHMDWLKITKEKYNQVLQFYYYLLAEHREWLLLSNQKLLRQLEIVTVGEKQTKTEPIYPLAIDKVPLYFRRAAINNAISMIRSYMVREKAKENKIVNLAKQFNSSPVYYKGMYKEFEKNTILLKLWNGKSWVWVKYSLKNVGRIIPEQSKCLSPSIKLDGNQVFLHIPVITKVEDTRKVKQRLEDKEKICSVSFPNGNSLAVCTIFDSDGRFKKAFFIKGGNRLKHRRKYYQSRIKRNRQNGQTASSWEGKKIHNLTEYYAHKISKDIVQFCIANHVKIIVVPHYRETLQLNSIGYLSATEYDWIGRRIINYLNYKAFQSGIVMAKVNPHHTADRCFSCKEGIKRYNSNYSANKNFYGGKLFYCPNGHRGNTAFNTARNIGVNFLEKYI